MADAGNTSDSRSSHERAASVVFAGPPQLASSAAFVTQARCDRKRGMLLSTACYGASAVICLVILFFSLQLWRAILHIPFAYTVEGDDSFLFMMLTKTMSETGWISHNPLLGSPGMLEQLDYPLPEILHWGTIRVLFLFIRDYGVVFNVFFLLAFPLIAMTSTFAARQLGLKPITAIFISELFTFLPYHMMRGETHMGLSAYYAVPLTIPIILQIAAGHRLFDFSKEGLIRGWTLRRIGAVLICVLIALSNPYYAAFTCFFLVVSACVAMRRFGRPWSSGLTDAGILIGVIFLSVSLELTPNILFSAEHGSNPVAVTHLLSDGDTYGLKLAQLLLPVPGHRIPELAAIRDSYAKSFPMINENESSALGFIGEAAFLVLLARAVFGLVDKKTLEEKLDPTSRMLDDMAILVLAAVLLGTVGGFGSTFSFLVTTTLRAYNRISLFISFFSLVAVGIAVERVCTRIVVQQRVAGELLIFSILLVLGLLDQISPDRVPDYYSAARDFASDQHFVEKIESSVPAGAAVFQLPEMRYLVSPPIFHLTEWQLFRGYLHSNTLHWSYGAMEGRAGDHWQRQALSQPLANALQTLRTQGFSGIYLDRRGFPDQQTEESIAALLGRPIISEDRHLVFFRL